MMHPISSRANQPGFMTVLSLCALAAIVLGGCASSGKTTVRSEPSAASAPPAYVIRLAPVPTSALRPGFLRVSEAIAMGKVAAGDTLLSLPHVASNVPTVAKQLQQIEARDEQGPLRLQFRDVGEGAQSERQWFASRGVSGTLHFRYRAPVSTHLAARGAAPPIDLRSEKGAISGAMATFLVQPPDGEFRVKLEWEIADDAPAVQALSSLHGKTWHVMDMDTLDRVYVMAGHMGQYPTAPTGDGFFSGWQGDPSFDVKALMAWTQELRRHFQAFFDVPPTPYGVFMRSNKVNPGGGMGMYHSFVVTYGQDKGNDPEQLKLTLAHEMFHTFQPRMRPEPGQSPLSVSWFNEGMAMFYQARLPFRFNMIGARTYLDDINYIAGRYYTNILGDTPNSKVPEGFWKDTRIRTLPYDRGFLYFVTVDEAMRKASNGTRSLDDLMLAMLAREHEQGALHIADWEAVLRDNIGEAAVQRLHAMLNGSAPLPSSDAFGPCFERVSRNLRRYQLGFAPAVLTESPRVVRGLIPGSAADRAGVRNGDVITRPVGQDQIQGEQNGILTLHLLRDGEEMVVSYKPRGETVSSWQWALKPQTNHAACGVPVD